MGRRSKISLIEPAIVEDFNSLQSRIFTRKQLSEIFQKKRNEWQLPANTTLSKFTNYLLINTHLTTIKFQFPNKNLHRFIWKEATQYEIVLSISSESYLSHYTAMFTHGLTEQIPKVIYLNIEQKQTGKSQSTKLSQERIDAAFKKQVRVSHEVSRYNDLQVCILHGKNTNKLGVTTFDRFQKETISVTDLERTLIDIAVRPVYSGGVFQVLEAYKRAKDKVSINRLTAMLQKLDYTYPYHQVIGFYLTKAGVYKKSVIDLLRRFPIEYNFYLQHNMVNPDYCSEWQLYIPKGF